MLFWLLLSLLILSIIVLIMSCVSYYNANPRKSLAGRIVAYIDTVVFAVLLVIVLISSYIIFTQNSDANATAEIYKERYEALLYKVESKSYRDHFGLLDKEVIKEIQEWNEDIAYHKEIQHDFWLGIYYPDIYDQFETIDYESYTIGD